MKLYLAIAIVALVMGAYVMGYKIAEQKCVADTATAGTKEIIKTIYLKRKTDEKVYNTGADDIRRILHDRYSIAE